MLSFYSIAFIAKPMMIHETWPWCEVTCEERVDSKKMGLKQKEAFMMYYINKNWYHFFIEYLENFQKFAFQEVVHPVMRPNIHTTPSDARWLPKTVVWVLGYITEYMYKYIYIHIYIYIYIYIYWLNNNDWDLTY